jgi:phage gpG-like protein
MFIRSLKLEFSKDKLLRDVARMAAVESVKFFKESFVKGGFTDSSFAKWEDRGSPLGGKKLMYNTGTLKQSIRTSEVDERRMVVTSETRYSAIHNEGGTITVTMNMKKHWWKMYYFFAGQIKKTKKGQVAKTKKNQKLNAKAEFCKRMALMKVGSKIKIPKRQFIGESQKLFSLLESNYINRIIPEIEKILFE